MKRRDVLLRLLAVGAASSPLLSVAQQNARVWRVGFLAGEGREPYHDGFTRGMNELRYVEGTNLQIDWRFADGKYERLAGLAKDLVNTKPDVLVTASTPATKAAQKATSAIPIVMGTVGDPVATGIVASLARPGGNITGLSLATTETSTKWFQLAKSVVPSASRVAILGNPGNPTYSIHVKNIQSAALSQGISVLPLNASSPTEIERAFATMERERASVLIVLPDGFLSNEAPRVTRLAINHRLPAIATTGLYAEAGALISYGQDYAAYFRRAATHVDKIFKGAKPSELPVEQPNFFQLIVNRKSAAALGLTISNELLLRADRVLD